MDYPTFEMRFGKLRTSSRESDAEGILQALLTDWGWPSRCIRKRRRMPPPNTGVVDFAVQAAGADVMAIEVKCPARTLPLTGPWRAELHAELGWCVEGYDRNPLNQLWSYGHWLFGASGAGPKPHLAVLTNGFQWLVFDADVMVETWNERDRQCELTRGRYRPGGGRPLEDCPVVVATLEPLLAISASDESRLHRLQGLLGINAYSRNAV